MIVDPFDRTQGITDDARPAAQVWLLPAGANPTDMSAATFLGLADLGPTCADHPDYSEQRCAE